MIKTSILALLIAAAPTTNQIDHNDGATARWVDLGKDGKAKLDLAIGKHRATVELTVAQMPQGWPDVMSIGPGRVNGGPAASPDRMITIVDIRVDGCAVYQPWPGIAGFVAPNNASLQFVSGHWQLQITGSDGAESYGVVYAFDSQAILARELNWGTDYEEETSYKIAVDPDVSPRNCVIH